MQVWSISSYVSYVIFHVRVMSVQNNRLTVALDFWIIFLVNIHNLANPQGYSRQAVQLTVLEVFVVVDYPLASCVLV